MNRLAQIVNTMISNNLTVEVEDGLAQLVLYGFNDDFGRNLEERTLIPLVEEEYYAGGMVDVAKLLQFQMKHAKEQAEESLVTQGQYDQLKEELRVQSLTYDQLMDELFQDLLAIRILLTRIYTFYDLGAQDEVGVVSDRISLKLKTWITMFFGKLIGDNISFSASLKDFDMKAVEDYINTNNHG